MQMHVIQLLLPLHDNAGQPFPPARFAQVRAELAERFGGVTAYTRAPATGLWEDDHGRLQRDEVVLFEVMADALDRAWWLHYRNALQVRFCQDEILVRATLAERL